MEFMKAGFDVLCSDLDVIWLDDPRPWVLGTANTSALLGLADVVVSTDVTHASTDKVSAQGEVRPWASRVTAAAWRQSCGGQPHALLSLLPAVAAASLPRRFDESGVGAPCVREGRGALGDQRRDEHRDGAVALHRGRDGLLPQVAGAYAAGDAQSGKAQLGDGAVVDQRSGVCGKLALPPSSSSYPCSGVLPCPCNTTQHHLAA